MARNTKKIILAKTSLIRKGKKKSKVLMVKIPIMDKKTGKVTGYKDEELDIDNPIHVKYAVVPSYFIIENVMNLMKQIFLVTHITRKTTI